MLNEADYGLRTTDNGLVSISGYTHEYCNPECRSPYRAGTSCVQLLGIVSEKNSTPAHARRCHRAGARSTLPPAAAAAGTDRGVSLTPLGYALMAARTP